MCLFMGEVGLVRCTRRLAGPAEVLCALGARVVEVVGEDTMVGKQWPGEPSVVNNVLLYGARSGGPVAVYVLYIAPVR